VLADCKKELSPSAFYVRDSNLYCVDDYQKKFGVRCKACSKVVEGEVITALGFTYHISCLSCSKCRYRIDWLFVDFVCYKLTVVISFIQPVLLWSGYCCV
jgi:hypothetical protein